MSLLAIAPALLKFAKAQAAVGDGRTHAARLGERQCLAVVELTQPCIETIRVGGEVAEQMLRLSREPRLAQRGLNRALAKAPCLIKSAERQRGMPQPIIDPSEHNEVSLRDIPREKLLTFPQSV